MAKLIDKLLKIEYELEKKRSYILGREEIADIAIPNFQTHVSRVHGVIKGKDNEWLYMDLNSKFGTKINGKRWGYENGLYELKNNDELLLGCDGEQPYKMVFKET